MSQATKTAGNVAEQAQEILHDTAGVYWEADKLYHYINKAQNVIAMTRGDKMSTLTTLELATGETKQKIAAGSMKLLDVVRNMGSDGLSPGNAIRRASKRTLDAFDPGWHTTTPAIAVKEWFPDPSENAIDFYVYPAAHGSTAVHLEVEVVQYPTDVNSADDTLSTPDELFPAVLDYVLFRAYSEDQEDKNDASAQQHLQNFVGILGITPQQVEQAEKS